MLAKRLIACLDVRDGRVVKGRELHRPPSRRRAPELAERYMPRASTNSSCWTSRPRSRVGARCGYHPRRVAPLFIPLTVGGGIRALDDAREVMDAGADKVSLNSAALATRRSITELARLYGSQAVIVAIDASRGDTLVRGASRAHACEAAGGGRWRPRPPTTARVRSC